MPVEERPGAGRAACTHLEAAGRLLCGIAPWLELDGGDERERRVREELRQLAVRGIAQGVLSDGPDSQVAGYYLGLNPSAQGSFFVTTAANQTDGVEFRTFGHGVNTFPPPGRWYHLVGTYDGRVFRCYVRRGGFAPPDVRQVTRLQGGRAGPPDPPQRQACYRKSFHHEARARQGREETLRQLFQQKLITNTTPGAFQERYRATVPQGLCHSITPD